MKRKIFITISFLGVILTASRALAASATDIGTIKLPWSSTLVTTSDLLNRVGNWFIAIIGPLAVVAIVYSGLMYIMSHNTENAATAKKNLTWAIIGIVVVLFSFLIIKEIAGIFK